MRLCLYPTEIRQLVDRVFQEYGAGVEELDGVREDILIEDGRQAARSYRTADLFAMWLIEVGILQFYDAEGNMLRTVNLFEEANRQRMAA